MKKNIVVLASIFALSSTLWAVSWEEIEKSKKEDQSSWEKTEETWETIKSETKDTWETTKDNTKSMWDNLKDIVKDKDKD